MGETFLWHTGVVQRRLLGPSVAVTWWTGSLKLALPLTAVKLWYMEIDWCKGESSNILPTSMNFGMSTCFIDFFKRVLNRVLLLLMQTRPHRKDIKRLSIHPHPLGPKLWRSHILAPDLFLISCVTLGKSQPFWISVASSVKFGEMCSYPMWTFCDFMCMENSQETELGKRENQVKI